MNYIKAIISILEYASQNEGKLLVEPFKEKKLNNILEQLFYNNFIKGSIRKTNDGRIFKIDYVTLNGYQTLEILNKSSNDKFKDYIKANGIPINISDITKLVANLIF